MATAWSPPQPFSVTVVPDRQEVAVVPAGELDLMSAGELEREVAGLYERGFDRVVVDLRSVSFMDSSGLGTLVTLRNAARRQAHAFVLIPGGWPVERLFEVSGTRGLFDWRDY